MYRGGLRKFVVMLSCGAAPLTFSSGAVAQVVPPEATLPTTVASDAPPAADDLAVTTGDIVVTARKRSETLINVPVVVTALGSADLQRYRADSLATIGQLVPSLVIGKYGVGGGGSIALRGISTTAQSNGLEQSVSVAIDGVQTSKGRIATLGFFDLQQVEVLKGPQALLFGKNSPGGVISIKTAGPTDTFELSAKAGYEVVGDELSTEVAVSGPIGADSGARLAVRYRYLDGWLRNTARPIANPFFNQANGAATGAPAGVAQLPGAAETRPGDSELMGRLTFESRPTNALSVRLKIFGEAQYDDKPGANSQNIGPCVGGVPRMYGIVDPFGDCVADNRVTSGDLPQVKANTIKGDYVRADGGAKQRALVSSLNVDWDLGAVTLTSLTGLNIVKYSFFDGFDQTTYSQLSYSEDTLNSELSQELRLTSQLSGKFNFMLGGYFQHNTVELKHDGLTNDRNYSVVSGRFTTYQDLSNERDTAYSLFAQGIFKFTPDLELAGGLRWSHERKSVRRTNVYGIGVNDLTGKIFAGSDEPGVIKSRYSESNVSPEVTLSWHPRPNTTLFGGYRTGFKSGGFNLNTALQVSTAPGDIAFRSEKAKGFEAGAKGLFLDNRLRLTLAGYAYNYKNLQVSAFDPVRFSSVSTNAGRLKQRGVELEANFVANDVLTLHTGLNYVRNRYRDYIGACYTYTYATGTVRATATAPIGCYFLNSTTLTLRQDFTGRAPARSPVFSGNGGAVITLPMGDNKLQLTSDAYYTDGYYAAETMSPFSYQRSYWRFNSGVTLGAADDRWTVSLLGRNLSNHYYVVFASDRSGGNTPAGFGEQRGVVARGREIELRASVRF